MKIHVHNKLMNNRAAGSFRINVEKINKLIAEFIEVHRKIVSRVKLI